MPVIKKARPRVGLFEAPSKLFVRTHRFDLVGDAPLFVLDCRCHPIRSGLNFPIV
jgi:hypothetical protein